MRLQQLIIRLSTYSWAAFIAHGLRGGVGGGGMSVTRGGSRIDQYLEIRPGYHTAERLSPAPGSGF